MGKHAKERKEEMKKAFRMAALMLCIVLVVGAFAGCNSGTNTKDGDTKTTVNNSNKETEKSTTIEANKDRGEQNSEIAGWKGGFTEEQLASFYNVAIKVGYSDRKSVV